MTTQKDRRIARLNRNLANALAALETIAALDGARQGEGAVIAHRALQAALNDNEIQD